MNEYKKIYRKMFEFHKRYSNKDPNFYKLSQELSSFETQFEIDLAISIISEIERKHKEVLDKCLIPMYNDLK